MGSGLGLRCGAELSAVAGAEGPVEDAAPDPDYCQSA